LAIIKTRISVTSHYNFRFRGLGLFKPHPLIEWQLAFSTMLDAEDGAY